MDLKRGRCADDARVGPLRLVIRILHGPPSRSRPHASADMSPILERIQTTARAILAALLTATTTGPLPCLLEVVTAPRGAALSAARVIHADHAGLEGAEEGLEVRDAREDDAEGLHGQLTDHGGPGAKGAVRRPVRTDAEDELGDDGSHDEDAEGKDYDDDGLLRLRDLHLAHDDGWDYDEEDLSDDVEDSEVYPERSLL